MLVLLLQDRQRYQWTRGISDRLLICTRQRRRHAKSGEGVQGNRRRLTEDVPWRYTLGTKRCHLVRLNFLLSGHVSLLLLSRRWSSSSRSTRELRDASRVRTRPLEREQRVHYHAPRRGPLRRHHRRRRGRLRARQLGIARRPHRLEFDQLAGAAQGGAPFGARLGVSAALQRLHPLRARLIQPAVSRLLLVRSVRAPIRGAGRFLHDQQ